MNLRWFETFRRVVELQSYTRAAESLALSQPAVSQQIRNLEEYFGEPLLMRPSGKVQVTAAGRKVYAVAVRVADEVGRLRHELADAGRHPEGSVRIVAGPTALCHYIPRLLQRLWSEYPAISVRTLTLVGQPMTDAVLQNHADVAIQSGLHLSERLVTTPCMDDHIILVCAPEHPLAAAEFVPARELAGMKIGVLSPQSEASRLIDAWLLGQGVTLSQPIEFGATEAIRAAVLAGLLVGFVSRYSVSDDLAAGRLRQVRTDGPAAVRRMYALHHPNPPEAVARLLRVVDSLHTEPEFRGDDRGVTA